MEDFAFFLILAAGINCIEIILATDLSFGLSVFAKSKLVFMSGCLPARSMNISPQNLKMISLKAEFYQWPRRVVLY